MAHEVKLIKGRKSLVISSGRYGLGNDFVPPATRWALNMSGSTSANRYGGSTVVSRRAVNVEIGFTLYVNGISKAEVDRGVQELATLLDQAGDELEPLYLAWRSDADLPEPILGQFGAALRLEIVSGAVNRDSLYGLANLRGSAARLMLNLVAKPFWLGTTTTMALCDGGILSARFRYYGDGRSRGIILSPAMVNKFSNPVFMQNTDPDNGWTATTALLEINQDPRYALFGEYSAKVIAADGAGTLTDEIDADSTAAHVLSCYAKLPDSGVISATQCQLYYDSGALTTTYTALGDGWYRLTAAVTVADAAKKYGLYVASGYTVYADGFQLEAGAVVTELAYGDLPGCTWGGTAHASITERAAGYLKIYGDDLFNQSTSYTSAVAYPAGVSIAVVWKADFSNTYASDEHFFDAGSFEAYFKASDDKIYFTDGTNTISTAAQTFAAGDVLHLVFVAGPGSMVIYKNGASAASGSAYDPTNWYTTDLFVGSNTSAANLLRGILQGFTVYGTALTAAQALSIYTAAAPLIADGEMVDTIPYQWVYVLSGGTGIYSFAGSHNYYILDGIDGNAPAITLMHINGSGDGAFLALNAVEEYQNMDGVFKDCQGPVVAGALNGQVDRSAAFTTAETTIPESAERIAIRWPPRNYQGKQLYVAAGILDNGTGLKAALKCGNIQGDARALAADTTQRAFVVGPVTIPRMVTPDGFYIKPASQSIALVCTRTGSSATVDIDWYCLLVGKVCYLPSDYVLLRGNRAYKYATVDGETALSDAENPRGDPIEFEPGKINYLTCITAAEAEAITVATDAIAAVVRRITPRWSVV